MAAPASRATRWLFDVTFVYTPQVLVGGLKASVRRDGVSCRIVGLCNPGILGGPVEFEVEGF
jgi:hypothetical protein